jgi:selenoprotein W-related protein
MNMNSAAWPTFGVVEPKTGRHFTTAAPNRSGAEFARIVGQVVEQYPAASTIHLLMDFGTLNDFTKRLTQDYYYSVNQYWLDTFHVNGFRFDDAPECWDGPTGVAYANLVFSTFQYIKSKVGATRRRVEIEYCAQCRWLLRAAWMAEELLTTFQDEIGEAAMIPATGGVFEVRVDGESVWSHPQERVFPEIKQLVRAGGLSREISA